MRMSKKILISACALCMSVGITACSSGSGSSDSKTDQKTMNEKQREKVLALKDQLPDKDLKDKTVTWFGHYDIRPSEGQLENAGITLFEEKYGGKIDYKKTTWDNRYSDLTKYVLTSDAPDFFQADDMDAYPKGAIQNMFDPIDDVMDLDSDIWKSSKNNMDAFQFNGKHYVAVKSIAPRYVCIYNKVTMDENQFDHPADLYYDDEWTWSKFAEMCEDFTDSTNNKYGLDGYFYPMALNDTCGVPLISLENGKIVSNLENKEVAKVQENMYQLQKKEVCFPRVNNSWKPRGNGENGDGIGSNLTLFEPIGLYAIENTAEKTKLFGSIKDDEVMFVPMPRMDDSDTYYASAKIEGYLMCHNAKNPEGFAALMDCMKLTTDATDDIHYEQLKEDYNWTDDMIKMRKECYQLAQDHPVFDFSYGVTKELREAMEQSINQATMMTGDKTTTWTTCVKTWKSYVDGQIKAANGKLS